MTVPITLTLPTYIKDPDHDNYHEELNQSLQYYLSPNGFPVPQINAATLATVFANYADGQIWYVVDSTPPEFVGKQGGALVKFTTTAYP
jgi:hypothetical protein